MMRFVSAKVRKRNRVIIWKTEWASPKIQEGFSESLRTQGQRELLVHIVIVLVIWYINARCLSLYCRIHLQQLDQCKILSMARVDSLKSVYHGQQLLCHNHNIQFKSTTPAEQCVPSLDQSVCCSNIMFHLSLPSV